MAQRKPVPKPAQKPVPYMELFAGNPHHTEQVLNALAAASSSILRFKQNPDGDNIRLCADASLSAVYSLLDGCTQRRQEIKCC